MEILTTAARSQGRVLCERMGGRLIGDPAARRDGYACFEIDDIPAESALHPRRHG